MWGILHLLLPFFAYPKIMLFMYRLLGELQGWEKNVKTRCGGSMSGLMVNMRLHVSGNASKKLWHFTLYFAMFWPCVWEAARPEDQGMHRY